MNRLEARTIALGWIADVLDIVMNTDSPAGLDGRLLTPEELRKVNAEMEKIRDRIASRHAQAFLKLTEVEGRMRFGTPVWVTRGGSPAQGKPGCHREVPGVLVGACGHQVRVRLTADDPYDTVGWNKAGQIGTWERSSIRRRI